MIRLIDGVSRLGLQLEARQLDQFELYYHELVEWNEKINLTSITGYREVEIKHFLDSLTVTLALGHDELKFLPSIADVGSGAGFPGIPLKILLSSPRLVLIEATAKKAAFLQHLVLKLELDGVEVVQGRSEDIAHEDMYRERFALVVSRAVAKLPSLVELALPFCSVGGKFVALKKGDIAREVIEASKVIALMGGRLTEIKAVAMEEFSEDERYLVILDKISSTEERYPRCSRMVKRRPL